MTGGNWDRDLKREDKRSEKRRRGKYNIYAYPDLPQLEDEGARRDWSHNFDVRVNGRKQSDWIWEAGGEGWGMMAVESQPGGLRSKSEVFK